MESTILNDQTEISNSRDFKLRRKHARLSLAICCRTRMINRENNAVCIALVYPDNYAEIGKIWLFEIAHFSFRGNNIRILGSEMERRSVRYWHRWMLVRDWRYKSRGWH